MSTSITVRRYLDRQDVRYATIPFSGPCEDVFRDGTDMLPASKIAKAIILKDVRGLIMAVLPGPNELNVDILNRQLHRNLQKADLADFKGIFNDCADHVFPPLGEAYGFETIIDDDLLDLDLIFMVSGNNNEFIRISGYDFQLLHSNAWFGNSFSQAKDELKAKEIAATEEKKPTVIPKIKQQIEKITNLPPMPTMAQKIIQLNSNPYAHADDLAKLIEKDPSLSAQIIRYGQSPIYGYQGTISSVRQSISRVLGYDLVMNIALGIATTRPFKNASGGPLGLHAYWRHATYSATLAQALSNAMPRKSRPRVGTAYLCGLLHNFGYLLLGYLFPKEFALLNNMVKENNNEPLIEQEMELLGTNHCEIGRWLMESWNMPLEISIAMSEHHNADYDGPMAEYPRILYVSDSLLKNHDFGDASTDDLPSEMIEALGLTEYQVTAALEKVLKGSDDLDTMARQLVA